MVLFQQCPKRFLYPSLLKQHMTLHTGELPFACTYCSMKYRLRKNLIAHMRSHTGEKPHACKFCGKRFTDYPGLHYHYNSFHKNDIVSKQIEEIKGNDDIGKLSKIHSTFSIEFLENDSIDELLNT